MTRITEANHKMLTDAGIRVIIARRGRAEISRLICPNLARFRVYKPRHDEVNCSSLHDFRAAALPPRTGEPGPDAQCTSQFRIEWQVVNRFRLFAGPAASSRSTRMPGGNICCTSTARTWTSDERDSFVARTSVLGSEHVLNDRCIAFSNILRKNFDWRGWAARGEAGLCYDSEEAHPLRPAAASTPI